MRAATAQEERGSVSVFVIGLAVALLVLAGLVVDGGRAVNARAAAYDDAEQAARAGANEIDVLRLRNTGQVVIDADAATRAVDAFLAARDYPAGSAVTVVGAREVRVKLDGDVNTSLLTLINIDSFHVTATATARAAIGIDAEIGGAP
ncbi:MAG: pilus assembly protein TadG-related protein [Brevundimonas sp.]